MWFPSSCNSRDFSLLQSVRSVSVARTVSYLVCTTSFLCVGLKLLSAWTRQFQLSADVKSEWSYTSTYLLHTSSMQQNPSWEANRFSSSQEIPRILWNLKVHYRIHKCFPCKYFVKDRFLWWGVVGPSPNPPQAGEPPLVGCPRLFIQYIRSYPSYWRPFFHPQPEDAPCHGDRDPLVTGYTTPLPAFLRDV